MDGWAHPWRWVKEPPMSSCFSAQSGAGPGSSGIWSGGLFGCLCNEVFWGCPAEGRGMYNIYGSEAGGITSPILPGKTLAFLWKKQRYESTAEIADLQSWNQRKVKWNKVNQEKNKAPFSKEIHINSTRLVCMQLWYQYHTGAAARLPVGHMNTRSFAKKLKLFKWNKDVILNIKYNSWGNCLTFKMKVKNWTKSVRIRTLKKIQETIFTWLSLIQFKASKSHKMSDFTHADQTSRENTSIRWNSKVMLQIAATN